MSYTNFPKNADKNAGISVPGKATYYQLSTTAKPVPTTEELASGEEITLIETDTHNRYTWVGDVTGSWKLTHYNGALNVHSIEAHNKIINRYFHIHSGTTTTLSVAAAVNDTQVTVVSAASFVAGDVLAFYDTLTSSHWYAIVTVVAGNLITLDRRIDFAMPIGYTVELVTIDMAAVGTLGSPLIYGIGPPVGEVWYITRIIVSVVHSTQGDLGLFGDIAPLTNGMTLRAYINGVYNSFTSWKTSGDMKNDMYTVEFDARSGGGGVYGTSALGDFRELNTVVRLDGTVGDKLYAYVQDDQSGLLSLKIKGQGRVELV